MDTLNFERSVDDLGERARPQIEQARKHLARLDDRITSFIHDHPAACLLGAVALGYLVARVARRAG